MTSVFSQLDFRGDGLQVVAGAVDFRLSVDFPQDRSWKGASELRQPPRWLRERSQSRPFGRCLSSGAGKNQRIAFFAFLWFKWSGPNPLRNSIETF